MDDALDRMKQEHLSGTASLSAAAAASTDDACSKGSDAGRPSKKQKREAQKPIPDGQHGGQKGAVISESNKQNASQQGRREQPAGGIAEDVAQDKLGQGDGGPQMADEQPHEAEWQPSLIMLGSATRSLINDKAAACLGTAIEARLQTYRQPGVQADVKQLREAEQQCHRLKYQDEHSKAVVSALRLVVQEKEILLDALHAVQSI